MRKVFSYFVLALCLIVSTQVNAAKVATMVINEGAPQDVENLTEAIYAVGESENQTAVITLTADATLNRTPGFHRGKPEKDAEADRTWLNNGENITIDLAGYDITEATLRVNIANAKVQVINNGDKKSNIDASGYMQTFTLYGVSETDESVAPDACYFKLGKNILLKGDAYMVCAMYYGSFAGTSVDGRPTYGMTIDIEGELKATAGTAMANNGTMSFKTGNKAKCPIINISGTAKITGPNTLEEIMGANTSDASGEAKAVYNYYVAKGQSGNQLYKNTSAAVYGPGYSVWNVKGHLEGGVGIYIKSGVYNIDGADIIATADEYWEPIAYGNGFIGAGSAVIFDANKGYGGDITMNIDGDTKVSSESGYAIQDINTNSSTTAVSKLQIQSGSFESNAGGDVIVTTPDLQQQLKTGTDCKISGGTYGSNIVDYLPNVGGVVTPVVDEHGNEVYVINVMPEEAQQEGWLTDINEASETSYVKYEGAATADITLTKAETKCAYLTITNTQKLIIADGQVLSAGEIVLGENAVIEVEAGGKLIVNGTNGIVAFNADNLKLEATAESSAIFMLNPAVKANKNPMATVELVSTSFVADATSFQNQRIAIPFIGAPADLKSEDNVEVRFMRYNDNTDQWDNLGYLNKSASHSTGADLDLASLDAPFADFLITVYDATPGKKLTFTGNLVGISSEKMAMKAHWWNSFGNSYFAKMSIAELLEKLDGKFSGSQENIAIYVQKSIGNNKFEWKPITAADLMISTNKQEIDAMETFMIKNDGGAMELDIDYNDLIWIPSQE